MPPLNEDATGLFYAWVWPHRAMVLRTARFLTRNAAEADDLAQETLVKAFKFISQFDAASGGNAKAWLSSILRNTWIDRLRQTGRRGGNTLTLDLDTADIVAATAETALPDVTDPAALLEQFSDADMISALCALPEEIRWTLMLVDVEQLDHADAAQVLGIPEGTVKSRAHRGRQMLRTHLTAEASG